MTRQQIIASSVELTQRETLRDQRHHIDDKQGRVIGMDTIPHIPMLLMLTPSERTLMIELVLTQELALHKSTLGRVQLSPAEIAWQDGMKSLCVKVRECLDQSSSVVHDEA
jgi:hypothetical protein